MSVHAKWVIGKVIGTQMVKTAKVSVTRLVLDPYLLKVKCDPAHLLFYFSLNKFTEFGTDVL